MVKSSVREPSNAIHLEKGWKTIFDKFDRDGDGEIPLEEIQSLLSDANRNADELPAPVLQLLLEQADLDRNKKLTYPEFLRMIQCAEMEEARPRFHRLLLMATATVVPRNQRVATVYRYIEEYNCRPPPLFMIFISIVQMGLFIWALASKGGAIDFGDPLIYNPKCRVQAWRFISYMFVHAGWVHLIFNILIQLVLGIPLEMVHKWWRIGLVYLAGVLAGSLGSSLSDPSAYLAGASGGVYALIAAHLANVILNWSEMEYSWARVLSLAAISVADIVTAVVERYNGEENSVSYAAHLAGALAGLLTGTSLLRNLRVHRWEQILRWITFAFYLVLLAAAVSVNAFYSAHFPPAECL